MKGLLTAARSALAVVVGYAVMVVLITLVQEVLFGGVSFYRSSLSELAVAGLLTTLSAVAGGFVAAALAGRAPLGHGLAMSVLVAIEMTALLSTGKLEGPLWFDLAAAASLVVGILAGALAWSLLRSRRLAVAAGSTAP